MSYTLGIDLGANSLGWAVLDETAERVIGLGVRIFPEGVDRDTTGAEHPKNEQRRIARGHRRQIARRARRKKAIRKALQSLGWWPQTADEESQLLLKNPYELRVKGLDQRLSLVEFGRVIVQLAQRRGFLSNRKADRGREKENSATLQEISALASSIESAGMRTLGEYLFHFPNDETHDRIRDRHTRRQMFQEEFDRLWEKQREFYPDQLTDLQKFGRKGKQTYPVQPNALKRQGGNTLLQEVGIYGILFFQRSLYWPKSIIGRCDLEPREKRCERADRRAQRFRLLNEVNNLRVIPQKTDPRPLTNAEREILIKRLSERKEASFADIRKWLGLLEGDGFNLEAGSRKKLDGAPIDYAMAHKSVFGKAWYSLSEELKNQIVRSLIDDEEPEILRKATTEWGCSNELALELADLDTSAIVAGYSSYSLTAITKLLPHLESGLPLTSRDGLPSALSEAGYLRPDQRSRKKIDLLPPPDDIPNPLVKQGLYELRKVVNAIVRQWGKPKTIHIELAREVRGSAEHRRKAAFEMRERESRRSKAADFIREYGGKPTREFIERYLLWKEQGEICFYSGRTISPQQLLGGEVDFDHVLPYSRSLDNSLMNKVLVYRDENHRKGQRTIWEWVGETDPRKYEAILQRAGSLPYEVRNRKLLKLKQKNVELDEFLNRQLSDTAYLTSQVREYMSPLVADSLRDLLCVKGQLTAELRQLWGLNSVLREDGIDLKSREDHRHHAVDALVIALTNRSRLQKLASSRYVPNEERSEIVPPPWKSFRNEVVDLIAGIKVSHRAVRDLRGALHEETFYGATFKPKPPVDPNRPHAKGWIEKPGVFVVRKKLEDLTLSMIDDIRDPRVKSLIVDRLRSHGIALDSKGPIPKAVWSIPLEMTRCEGRVSRNPAVIKKVRLLRTDSTIEPIRQGTAFIKPGNTHHIAIFELPESTPQKPKRDLVSVNMMKATTRAKNREPLISRVHPTIPQARFLFSLSSGEMVLAKFKGGEEAIYVFRTAASTTKQMVFVHYLDARKSAEAKKYTAKPDTLDAVKITIDPLGRIRNAND